MSTKVLQFGSIVR